MGWRQIVEPLLIITPSGGFTGLFVYSPVPGPGNLIASITSADTTDPFGNAVLGGLTSYFNGRASNQVNGNINTLHGPPSGTGPWTLDFQIFGGAAVTDFNLYNNNLSIGLIGHPFIFMGAGPPLSGALNLNTLELERALGLDSMPAPPATVAGIAQLYADAFTQLHTDRAFQTDINVETKNQGGALAAGGSGAKLYSVSGHQQVQSGQAGIGGDGNAYDCERLDVTIASGTVVNSAAGQTLASKPIGIGTYHIRGKVYYQGNQSAGTPTIGFSYPALSAGGSDTQYKVANTGATQAIPYYNSVGFDLIGTGHTGPALVLNQFIIFEFDGEITTTAAGNFIVQAKTSAVIDTYTIQPGSYLEIMPVVAT